MMVKYLRRLAAVASMVVLSACGGGGESGDGAAEGNAPQATAMALVSGDVRTDGSELHATVGGTVRLDARDASALGGDMAAYNWTLASRPAGSKLVVSGRSAVLSWQPDVVGRYAFMLTGRTAPAKRVRGSSKSTRTTGRRRPRS
ncbi:hypothetical protein HK414_09180 [Ramlibacter terrae]|uniref:Uncharacterized protein n=1 Tax=Ramlibacter terrae TaxID=2732511 RepID=A0ABX6P361_9BURK|nr:hypothetical protein HK414_09180 [Ramlibacter terrae]